MKASRSQRKDFSYHRASQPIHHGQGRRAQAGQRSCCVRCRVVGLQHDLPRRSNEDGYHGEEYSVLTVDWDGRQGNPVQLEGRPWPSGAHASAAKPKLLRMVYPVCHATDLDMFRTQIWLHGFACHGSLGFAALFPTRCCRCWVSSWAMARRKNLGYRLCMGLISVDSRRARSRNSHGRVTVCMCTAYSDT